jgi:MinD-like ATPase involved in chromosome partitioning or flagellar assembly
MSAFTLDQMYQQLEIIFEGEVPEDAKKDIARAFNEFHSQCIKNVLDFAKSDYVVTEGMNHKYEFVMEHKGSKTYEEFEKYLRTLPVDHELFCYIGY